MRKVLFIRLIGLMVVLLTGIQVLGQQAAILILDAKTKEPVPYANVCFEGLKSSVKKYNVTDMKGKVPNEMKEEAKVAISFIGYETLVDTIKPGQNISLNLMPAVLTMNEVVVTGQYTPERADKSIYKIHVINSRQIEQKAATNLADLLSSESNMRVDQGGVLGTSLSLQGLTGENVKFLMDGVPIVGRLNGNIDMNQLNLFNVDHVEIIEGPMSVIYGSNAIAGVVNIITKENKNASQTAFANAYYETAGTYNFNAGSSFRKNRNHFYLDLSRNFFDGFSQIDTSRSLMWKPRRQYNTDAYYLYTGDKIRVKISGQYFNELLLDKGALMKPYLETAFDSYYFTARVTSKGELTYNISKQQQVSLVGAYSSFDRKRKVYFNDLTRLEKNLSFGDTTAIGNYLVRAWYNHNYPEQKLNYQAGFDGSYEWNAGERIQGGTQRIGDYAAFISAKYEAFNKLFLQPGVRFIHNTKYKAPLVYSMNVKYSVSEHTALRVTYARGFRAPSLKELYLDFVDINHNLKGNPDLKAEYSNNFNLNFSYNRETQHAFLNTEAGLFYNYVNNTIWLFHSGSDITTYTYGNVAKFISQGVQASTSVSFYPAVSLKAGVSYVGRKFPENTIGATGDKFRYSTDMNAMASYKFIKMNASVILNYKYTGRFPELNPEGSFDNQYIEGYHMLDLTLMKNFFRNTLSLSIGGKNLLNVNTVKVAAIAGSAHSGTGDGTSLIAWGRTAFVKLAYNFNSF